MNGMKSFARSVKTNSFLQVFVGGIYVYAGLGKVFFPAYFGRALTEYKLIPSILHSSIRTVLPWVELVFGILLLMNMLPRISSIVLGLLTAAFMLTIGTHIMMGIRINDCGCFAQAVVVSKSIKSRYYEIGLIIRNMVILILCIKINGYEKIKVKA